MDMADVISKKVVGTHISYNVVPRLFHLWVIYISTRTTFKVFVFVVASYFRIDHKNKAFGYILNVNYCLWDPLTLSLKPKDKKA